MKVFTVTLVTARVEKVHADGYVRVDGRLLFHRLGSGLVAAFKETEVWDVVTEKPCGAPNRGQVPESRMEA